MSVELSPAPSPTRPSASSEAAGMKGKAHAGKEPQAGGNDAFSNLMMSLGEGDDATTEGEVGSIPGDKNALTDAAAGSGGLSVDALLARDGVAKEAGLSGQSLSLAQAAATAKVSAGQAGSGLNAGASAAVSGAMLTEGEGLAPGLADLAKRATKGNAASKAPLLVDAGSSSQSMGLPAAKEMLDAKMTLQADPAALGKLTPEMLSAVILADKDKNPTLAPAEKTSFKSQGPSGDGIWGAQASLATQRVDATVATDATTAYTPEMQVAEKVNYWISQDVQRAELKLDGVGHEPIEVSISMQGKEAMVEFRTDQPETRQVLEGSVAHLKDLLKGEGLVLSGVSVGSSGQNGADAQERKDRQAYRQAEVVAAEVKRMESVDRPSRTTGRSIDLFV